MPRGDRTGPEGRGPMTGRRMGYCAGFDAPGYAAGGFGGGRGMGRGFGRGMGRGRGWRRGYGPYAFEPVPAQYAPPYPPAAYPPVREPTTDEEKATLQYAVKELEAELKAVKDRLAELDSPSKKE